MAKVKDDSVTLRTSKSLKEITYGIRMAADKTRANITQLQSDALAAFDDKYDIEVGLEGFASFGNRAWCVQVYVDDCGDYREVILMAIGIKGFMEGNVCDLGLGKKKRDIIATYVI